MQRARNGSIKYLSYFCLIAPNLEAHVHFHLESNSGLVCPEPYFTPEARDSILNLIHREYPDSSICN